MKRKHFKDAIARYTRRSSPGLMGKSILIVTEGEKTEPTYLSELRKNLNLHSADIVPLPRKDPLSLIKESLRYRDRRKRETKRGCAVLYDAVWVVLDAEQANNNPKLPEALRLAREENINIALSNPCFEYWILLHDIYTTSPFRNCGEVLQRIKKDVDSNYEKNALNAISYIPKIPTAIKHSQQCRTHHQKIGGDHNPSTDVDILVLEMNESTRPHFRIMGSKL